MSLKFRVTLLISLILVTGKAQTGSNEWFPDKSAFPLLVYDLLETQVYSGVFLMNAQKDAYEGAYIPVNLGIRKCFFKWELLSMNFDLAFGAASYTQFEIIKYDATTLRGGLLNTDFKASGFLNAALGIHKFRLQLFHISSHLGDDYMLRNQQFELNNKSVNYEQLDITYLIETRRMSYYFGMGEVISPNTFRERFMIELGIQGNHRKTEKMDFIFGTDMKLYKENDFIPDMHSGVGVAFKKNEIQQIDFTLDSYFGSIPYSTLDYGKVFWIGISTRIVI